MRDITDYLNEKPAIGKRYRIANGELGVGRIFSSRESQVDKSFLNRFPREKDFQGFVNTYATITEKHPASGEMRMYVSTVKGNVEQSHWYSEKEIQKMIYRGALLESERKTMVCALASHAHESNLTPRIEMKTLWEQNANGMLTIGGPLIIDGVNYGTITDCTYNNGHVVLKTDMKKYLFSTIDFRNEYEMQSYGWHEPKNVNENILSNITSDDISFLIHQALYIDSNSFVNFVLSDSDFTEQLKIHIASYMEENHLTRFSDIGEQKIQDELIPMANCLMREYGYLPDRPRPSQEALEYLQSLGYSQEEMEIKKNILKRWVGEKDLTYNERVAAYAIINDKFVHVIKDIDKNQMYVKNNKYVFFDKYFQIDDLFEKINSFVERYIPTNDMESVFDEGGKVYATHIDLARGKEETGMIKIPYNVVDSDYEDKYITHRLYGDNSKMYVSWDISQEYRQFGGFDYSKAIERLKESRDLSRGNTEIEGQVEEQDIIDRSN